MDKEPAQTGNFSKDGVLVTILPYVKNKYVLDIGCVEHDLKNKHKERIWVHDFLKVHASHVTGIDILKSEVEQLERQGYDVSCQSAENFVFDRRFDVVFAGELIEHLNNPGLFLEQCFKHLTEEGCLILTTPNVFSISRLLAIIKKRTNDPPVNEQHTAWYSPKVLKELLKRYYFETKSISYVNYPKKETDFRDMIVNLLCSIFGNNFRETMILVTRKMTCS